MKQLSTLFMFFILFAGCSQIAVNENVLVERDGLKYQQDSTKPFKGKSCELWDNGNHKLCGFYQNGKQTGTWTWWYFSGQKMSEGTFLNGKREGTWTWWYEQGAKEREETYKDGKLNGHATRWEANGRISGELNYKDGKIVWE